jgi:hypothetical protein
MGDPIQGTVLDTKETISSAFPVFESSGTIASFFLSLCSSFLAWHLSFGLHPSQVLPAKTSKVLAQLSQRQTSMFGSGTLPAPTA